MTTRFGSIALVGRPNVGKSSLLNAMLGTKIAATTHKPQTTRRRLRGIVTEGDAQMVLVDTPGVLHVERGLHKFMLAEVQRAAQGVDAVCLIVEVGGRKRKKGGAENDLLDERDLSALETVASASDVDVPFVLVINKIDRLPDKAALLPLIAAWQERRAFSAIVPVSATKKDGIEELVRTLGAELPEGEHAFDRDALTDAGERDIAAELIREKAMLELEDELPYRIAVEVEEFDESRREEKKGLVEIQATLHVERDSQKGIVIGKGGARLKSIGTRARQELERLLDCKVMLRLFVRVETDWTRRPRGLKKLGYTEG